MIITANILENFDACDEQADLFYNRFPKGLDISPLWGRNKNNFIDTMLTDPFVRHNLGWAIKNGVIPLIEIEAYNMDLSGLDMSGAYLTYSSMIKCNIVKSQWRYSIIQYIDLYFSNIAFSNFRGAQFHSCTFAKSDLSNCDMTMASLNDVSLCGTNLLGTKFRNTIMRNIKYDDETIWPTKFDIRTISNKPA